MQNHEADYYRHLEALGACSEPDVFWCASCGDVEVLVDGHRCPECESRYCLPCFEAGRPIADVWAEGERECEDCAIGRVSKMESC